jgi:hypothetical protein
LARRDCLLFLFLEYHFNQLGSLRLSTEVLMLGLPMAAVCMGFFQMAMRDRAGFRRHSAPIIPQR